MSKKKVGPTPKRRWQPMTPAAPVGEHAEAFSRHSEPGTRIWINDRYTVISRPLEDDGTHLSIRRNDRKAAHDWRDLQRIKNDICGPDAEAVELYPSEDRLVDTANSYHLWVLAPGIRFPFGFDLGRVTDDGHGGITQDGTPIAVDAQDAAVVANARQRPVETGIGEPHG